MHHYLFEIEVPRPLAVLNLIKNIELEAGSVKLTRSQLLRAAHAFRIEVVYNYVSFARSTSEEYRGRVKIYHSNNSFFTTREIFLCRNIRNTRTMLRDLHHFLTPGQFLSKNYQSDWNWVAMRALPEVGSLVDMDSSIPLD